MPKTLPKSPKSKVVNRANATAGSAASPGRGKTVGELVRQSNRWRDNYNPLRNLVISRVVTILEAAERGDYAELQLVMRKVERRYPVLKALKSRRLAALEKLDWGIKVTPEKELPKGATKAMAEAQQNFLRSRYDLITNLTDAFGFLVTPEFRGYAILQKHRYLEGEHDGAVRELHWLPQDQFARDGAFGDFYYNKDSQPGPGLDSCQGILGEKNRIGSEELPREEFVIREVDAPLYEIALIAFVNWAMGRKDHAAFVEIFGLPKGVVIMPSNIPPGKEAEYQSAAEQVSDGVAGALPATADIKFPTAGLSTNAPFKEFCDAHDQDVVLAGTGGLLTMLSMPQGIGSGSSEQHGDAFDDLAQSDARKINAVLQRDFDKLELEAEFPGQPILAYFELCSIEEEDVTAVVESVTKLESAGLQTDVGEVSEKVSLQLTRVAKPAPVLVTDPNLPPNQTPPPGPIMNRAGDMTPEQALLAALNEKKDLVGQLVARLVAIKDDTQMVAALGELLKHADTLTALVTADATRLANALEQITAPALAAGLQGKTP